MAIHAIPGARYAQPAGGPSFAALKREAERLLARYGPAVEELAVLAGADEGFADGRRALILACDMRHLAATLARAASYEAVAAELARREQAPAAEAVPPQRSRLRCV